VSGRFHLPLTPLILGVAALAITYLGFTTARYVGRNIQVNRDEQRLEREIAQLDRDHDRLVAVRDYLMSDEYIIEIARRVLGLVRPGETLVVVSSSAPPTPIPTPGVEPTPPGEWWKALFIDPAATPAAFTAPTPSVARDSTGQNRQQ
jgi:cell division protein FtsB